MREEEKFSKERLAGELERLRGRLTEIEEAEGLREALRRQEALSALGQLALGAGADMKGLFEKATGLVAQGLDVERCGVLGLQPEGEEFYLVAGTGWRQGAAGRAKVSLRDIPADIHKPDSNGFVVFDGPDEEPCGQKTKKTVAGDMAGIGMGVVMRAGGEVFGILGVHTAQRSAFTEEERGFLKSVSGLLASAVERSKREEAALKAKKEWEDTFNALADIITVHDKDFNIITANKAAEKALGLPPMEGAQAKCYTYYHGKDTPPKNCPSCRVKTEPVVSQMFEPHLKRFIEISAIPRPEDGGDVSIIHIARDITEQKRHEMEMEAVVMVSAALRAATSRAEMLPIVLNQIVFFIRAEGAAIALCGKKCDDMAVETAIGRWEQTLKDVHLPGEAIKGHVITEDSPEGAFIKPFLAGDLLSFACVPLIAREQVIGAVLVGRSAKFAEDELRVLAVIGDIAANAIYRATLREQTERRLKHLAALRAIDIAISSSHDLRLTLNVFINQVVEELQVDATDLLLMNPRTHLLEYAVGRGFREYSAPRAVLRPGFGYAGRAAMERRIISIPDLRAEGVLKWNKAMISEGFVSYYGVPLIAKGEVKGVLEIFHRSRLAPDPEWLDFMDALSVQAAIAIDNAVLFDNLQRTNQELFMAYETTLEGWSRALDMRDKETEGHTQRVAELTVRIAQQAGMSEMELVHVRRGALLHDIGKMGIPDSILLKPGPLTEEEFEIMRRHCELAHELLHPIAYLRPALDIPYCHHEKWDGTGYPRGLKGEQIPLAARIFAVVDVWDALRSDRPYRPAWPKEKALKHIRSLSGVHFDPRLVDVFLHMEI